MKGPVAIVQTTNISFRLLQIVALCLQFIIFNPASNADEIKLPELGDTSSALISPKKEYELGRAWLQMFRSRVPLNNDPIVYEYMEHLIFKLAMHSELKDRRLEVVIIENPTINAFAVPGGVIGIHTGLLSNAKSEDELASVLSHELAHLSQRHYARSVEQAKANAIPTMAALLASFVLAATAGGDAGLAALTITQAAAMESQLRFSRQNESEADRIGIKTLAGAGMDPDAAARMFENMLAASRYSQRPPEFLLTHPISESRIADARYRAAQYGKKTYTENLEFHLIRARILLDFEENPGAAIKRFQSELEASSTYAEGNQYGLVLALTKNNQPEKAQKALDDLFAQYGHKIPFDLAQVDLNNNRKEYQKSREILEKLLALNPKNHPLTVSYAETLLKLQNFKLAETVLNEHVKLYPTNAQLWYLLAETHGLAGNIVGVHRARAEFFVLNGVLDKAHRQLTYALDLVKNDYQMAARIEERINDIEEMRRRQADL